MFSKLPLLAKSISPKEMQQLRAESTPAYINKLKGAAKYTGHISLVMQSADVLIDRLGQSILTQLGLEHLDPAYFANTVRLAAWLHDWGKNSSHFQEMLYLKTLDPKSTPEIKKLHKDIRDASKKHNDRQMLRHEIISGILALQIPAVRQWLEQLAKEKNANLMVAVWAAMGHHLKAGVASDGKPSGLTIAEIPDVKVSELRIYTNHADFKAMLRSGCQQFGVSSEEIPEFPDEIWSREKLERDLKCLFREFIEFESNLTWEEQRFVAAVKATVIAADLAGSALPLAEEDFKQWMEEVLDLKLTSDELQELLDRRLGDKPLRPFQQQIADSKHRVTLVTAGCGTGKTIGAYKWAQRHAEGKRLFFCYPTTGTASQGYIDYVDGTNIESELMHSRADLDRELLFSHESDNSSESDDAESIDTRMQAFQTWRKKLIVCTVDAVLGLIQNNRKPLYAWAAISQGTFVFDEVHAYDDRLFGALLQFLRAFRGAPILLMSASFTPGQLAKIREVMAELGEEIAEPIIGPPELEALPRYQFSSLVLDNPHESPEIWDLIIDTLKQKQKVLWVTNSVQTCIDIYRYAKTKLDLMGLEPLIYHSRFRYVDRLNKHQAIIDAFKSENQPVLAITTQVCEMSLDLSADLLVTAMAPAAAIIQRLGRLNRRVSQQSNGSYRLDSGKICTCIVYPWENSRPYKTELETGKQLVEKLKFNRSISQQDLAAVAIELGCHTPELIYSAWLETNWASYPDFLRTGGITITALLENDIAEIKKRAAQRKIDKGYQSFGQALMAEAQGWAVPIIPSKDWYGWKKISFYPIAPSYVITYCPKTGAESCK